LGSAFGVGSVIGVARKLGVHRRVVREAVRNAVPIQRKKTERPAVKMAPAVSLIDWILELDRKAPRKQRHTSRRIYDRIRAEIPGCTPAQRTVRQYVERRKQALGLAEHEVFVPQSYDWGVEAQVDWYEAYADLDGERIKLQVFEMRSMASGAAFHRAYPCATQQAFLKAHELAFEYFEGVFRRLRYDNLSSAVKKILRGQQRELTARFIAFCSHCSIMPSSVLPAKAMRRAAWRAKLATSAATTGFLCRWQPI
jgi:transposase